MKIKKNLAIKLVKELIQDENFKKDSKLKSENAVLRIKIPNWI